MSVTSQESSSQDIESDSKQSTNTTTVNNDSSSSPLSSCQTLTPTENDASINSQTVDKHNTAFDSQTLEKGNSSAPSIEKDACCNHNPNFKPVVNEQENSNFISEQLLDASKDKNKDLNSIQLLNDHKQSEVVVLKPKHSTGTFSSWNEEEVYETSHNNQHAHCTINSEELENGNIANSPQAVFTENTKEDRLENTLKLQDGTLQCNGDVTPANEDNLVDDSLKVGKQKKSGKQSNSKSKKNSKGKEDKQKKPAKTATTVNSSETVQKKSNKKKDENSVKNCAEQVRVNGIYSDVHTQEENEATNALNSIDDKEISNSDNKNCLLTTMDGKAVKPSRNEDIASSTQQQQASDSGAQKYDLIIDSENSSQIPPKSVQKEKQKSPPSNTHKGSLQKELPQAKIDATSMESNPMSLRPNVPKSKPKTHHGPSFPQQFRGTTDILDRITEALIKDPALQSTNPKDISVSKEKDTLIKGSKSDVMQVETGKQDIAASQELLLEGQSYFPVDVTSSQEEASILPSRFKSLSHSFNQSYQVAEAIGDVLEESSGGSTASSTTQESEESVIELLSSTHTSPEERLNQDLSSDEEENIIFIQNKAEGKSKIIDLKSIPPDKSELCTPSIAYPSVADSSQIFVESKCSTTESINLPQTSPIDKYNSIYSIVYIELYAEGLSKNIVLEAVHESSKKRLTLPITEAVTRWLRSQSPEILSLRPPEDETESDVSLEEQEQAETSAKADENKQQSTGQKNVFCNPLPVPSLENCNHLLINSNVNHNSYIDDTGRRVALNQKTTAHKKDNNEMTDKIAGNKRLESGGKNYSNLTNDEDNCEQCNPLKTNEPSQNTDIVFYNVDYNTVLKSTRKDKQVGQNINNFEIINGEKMPEDIKNKKYPINANKINENTNLNETDDNDDLSFASDETMECEWDLWDCNPTKPIQPSPTITKLSNVPTPIDEILGKTPEDYCSQMCDPAVSVAKYYSLGALQPNKKKCTKTDSDSSNYSEGIGAEEEEEVAEALKHFQHELEDDDGLQTCVSRDVQVEKGKRRYGNPEVYKSLYGEGHQVINLDDVGSRNMYSMSLLQQRQAARILQRKSSILVSRLKGEGPFPCGGICCILQ